MKLFIMNFSSLPCYLVPLRPKYSPQHPIVKHPQPTFLPQCQRHLLVIMNNIYIENNKYSQVCLLQTLRPALRPTRPPVPSVPGFFHGGKAAGA
jgi:hypothetical protein